MTNAYVEGCTDEFDEDLPDDDVDNYCEFVMDCDDRLLELDAHCPGCSSRAHYPDGVLGRLAWYTCRFCGLWFSVAVD